MQDQPTPPTAAVEPSCVRCAFAYKVTTANDIRGHYECRMAPPQVVAAIIKGNQIGSQVVFPVVTEDKFCFQFTPRNATS